MTRPYSNDLRERVVRAHLDGEPIRAVAARFGVSVSSCRSGRRATGRPAASRRARSAATVRGCWSRTASGCTRWWQRRRT